MNSRNNPNLLPAFLTPPSLPLSPLSCPSDGQFPQAYSQQTSSNSRKIIGGNNGKSIVSNNDVSDGFISNSGSNSNNFNDGWWQ